VSELHPDQRQAEDQAQLHVVHTGRSGEEGWVPRCTLGWGRGEEASVYLGGNLPHGLGWRVLEDSGDRSCWCFTRTRLGLPDPVSAQTERTVEWNNLGSLHPPLTLFPDVMGGK